LDPSGEIIKGNEDSNIIEVYYPGIYKLVYYHPDDPYKEIYSVDVDVKSRATDTNFYSRKLRTCDNNIRFQLRDC